MILASKYVIAGLLKAMFSGQPAIFQEIGAPLLGLFPFISMFLITSVTMLRERTSGTLERLMTMPIRKIDLLGGYGIAFGLLAAVQADVVAVLAIGNAVVGMALGLLGSAFATSEFQAVQSMPAVVLPQLLLCGLFVARSDMAHWLRIVSAGLPLGYGSEALAT